MNTNQMLPPLTGSEKQIQWAEKLRAKAIAEMEQDISRKEKMVETASEANKPRWERMLATSKEVYNDLISCTSASKIIDGWR